jgi:hypothetical protein
MVSCSPDTVFISTGVVSEVLSPKRIRSTGIIAAKENSDNTVESKLKRIFNAICPL